MRNGNISFGVLIAFVSGSFIGDLEYNESLWLIALVWLIALGGNFLAFDRVDRGLKEELAKAELLRKVNNLK
jgi:hypothetical protein